MSSRGAERPAGAAVLERIEQALRQRLAATDSLVTEPPNPAAPDPVSTPGGLHEEQIEGSVARAEQRSHEAEALVEEVTAALSIWRERAARLRQRLAEWPTRAL